MKKSLYVFNNQYLPQKYYFLLILLILCSCTQHSQND